MPTTPASSGFIKALLCRIIPPLEQTMRYTHLVCIVSRRLYAFGGLGNPGNACTKKPLTFAKRLVLMA